MPRARASSPTAICVRNHPMVTFWRRLTRDLRERRKPPLTRAAAARLAADARSEPQVVAHAVALGCDGDDAPTRPTRRSLGSSSLRRPLQPTLPAGTAARPAAAGRHRRSRTAYAGLITSLMSASRSSNGRNAHFIALMVNHRRSARP